MISLFTVSFLGALDHTVVATSLATIAGDLGAVQQMSWVIVSYTLASTVVLPVLGKLADLIGARFIFLASLVLFLVASLLCGFAQDMTQLALARIAQGVGSAGLHLMPQTIIGEVTSPRERPRVLSIIGAAFPVAILVGPLAGGLITDAWGWRWVFWINIPVGLIALALAVVAVPHIAGRSGRRFDIAGRGRPRHHRHRPRARRGLGEHRRTRQRHGGGRRRTRRDHRARRVHRDRAARAPSRSCRSATSRTARSSSRSSCRP